MYTLLKGPGSRQPRSCYDTLCLNTWRKVRGQILWRKLFTTVSHTAVAQAGFSRMRCSQYSHWVHGYTPLPISLHIMWIRNHLNILHGNNVEVITRDSGRGEVSAQHSVEASKGSLVRNLEIQSLRWGLDVPSYTIPSLWNRRQGKRKLMIWVEAMSIDLGFIIRAEFLQPKRCFGITLNFSYRSGLSCK